MTGSELELARLPSGLRGISHLLSTCESDYPYPFEVGLL